MNRNMPDTKYNGPRMDRGNERGNDRGNNDRNSGDRANDRGADRGGLRTDRGPQSSGGILRAPRGASGPMPTNTVRGTSFNRNTDNRSGTAGGVVRGGNGQGNNGPQPGAYGRR